MTEEKKRKIRVRDWFSDLDEGEKDSSSLPDVPGVDDLQTPLAQPEAPNQSKPGSDAPIQPVLDVKLRDASSSSWKVRWLAWIKQRLPRTQQGKTSRLTIEQFVLTAGIVLLISAILFAIIFYITDLGAEDESGNGLFRYLYLLFVLAISPYLFFLVYPLEKLRVMLLYSIVLLGGVFFQLRLSPTYLATAQGAFLSGFFILFYALVSVTMLVLLVWMQRKLIKPSMNFQIIWGIRIVYPSLLIFGFALIGLANLF